MDANQFVAQLHVGYLLQVTHSYNGYSRSTPESRKLLAEQLKAVPENFFDMRQVKATLKHPDFKHKATGEGLWLNSAPPEVAQLVNQWDVQQPTGSSKVRAYSRHLTKSGLKI